jgi:hypothetical protein
MTVDLTEPPASVGSPLEPPGPSVLTDMVLHDTDSPIPNEATASGEATGRAEPSTPTDICMVVNSAEMATQIEANSSILAIQQACNPAESAVPKLSQSQSCSQSPASGGGVASKNPGPGSLEQWDTIDDNSDSPTPMIKRTVSSNHHQYHTTYQCSRSCSGHSAHWSSMMGPHHVNEGEIMQMPEPQNARQNLVTKV